MKALRTNFLLLIMLGLIGGFQLRAQSAYVATEKPTECQKQISIYQQLIKLKYWNTAYYYWQKSYASCQVNRQIILNDGDKIISSLLSADRENLRLFDSLMIIYDQKAKLRNKTDYYRMKKAFAYYKYKAHSVENLDFIVQTLSQVQRQQPTRFPLQSLYLKYISVNDLALQHKLANKQFVEELLGDIEFALSSKSKKYIHKIVAYYEQNEVLSIDEIMENLPEEYSKHSLGIFTSYYFLENNSDAEKAIVDMDTFLANEKNQQYFIAKDFTNLYFLAALNAFNLNKLPVAKKYAQGVLLYPELAGKAYKLLGDIYHKEALNKNSSFYKPALYCLAVEMYKLAEQKDSKIKLSREIKALQNYFPTQEDLFFRSLKVNSNYKLGDWIQEEVILRTRDL